MSGSGLLCLGICLAGLGGLGGMVWMLGRSLRQPPLLDTPEGLALMQEVERDLSALAREHGLRFTHQDTGLRLEGSLGPRPFSLEVQLHNLRYAAVGVELTQPRPKSLPDGVHYGGLRGMQLRGLVMPSRDAWELEYQAGKWVTQQVVHPNHVAGLARQAIALAHRLERCLHPAWRELADRSGLTLETPEPAHPRRLRQTLDGLEVVATLHDRVLASQTRVECVLDSGLPPFRVVHAQHGRGERAALQHPIADSLLHAEAEDPRALRGWLHTHGAFEALMAVVHAFPGSEVTHDHVLLLAEGDLGEGLEDAMHSVRAAAATLRARV